MSSTHFSFFSLALVSLGYGKAAVGAFWAVSVVAEIAFFWFQGRFFHWLSPVGWLKLVAGVTTLRFVAVAAGGAVPVVLALAQASHAITFAGHHAACIALVHRHFPDRLRGRGQALYTMLGYGLSGVIGGVGGGWLIEGHGYPAVFWAAAGAGVLAWGCAQRAARHGA
ncbi:MAG: MFS transporter [Rubrivivax sp.]|nr:MFS transporter [Rubrivivax sp.]